MRVKVEKYDAASVGFKGYVTAHLLDEQGNVTGYFVKENPGRGRPTLRKVESATDSVAEVESDNE